MDYKALKEQLEKSAKIAVDELFKVIEEPIITGEDDDLSADRLKNAAATKKLAIFDIYDILERVKSETDKLTEAEEEEKASSKKKETKSFSGFKGRGKE